MRKLSRKHVKVLLWRATVRFRNEVSRCLKKKNRLRDTGHIKNIKNIKPTAFIIPPSDFTFESNYAEVIKYIEELRAEVSKIRPNSHDNVLADLKTIKRLCPSAAICLVAEMDRWQRVTGKRLHPRTVPEWNKTVRANLYSLGFFELLGTKLPVAYQKRSKSDDSIWLPFSSEVLVNGDVPKRLRQKIEEALGAVGIKKMDLYKPMIEAIKNAVEHAYPENFNSEQIKHTLGSRWWLLGVVNKQTRKITIIVYDQGITIPTSLPLSNFWEGVKAMFKNKSESDNARIEAAIEYGRTRTGLEERGKGLADIVAIADSGSENHIQIYSRCGRYHAVGGRVLHVPPSPVPLNGTLIRWDICL